MSERSTETSIREATAATVVHAPRSFRWRGESETPVSPSLQRHLGEKKLLEALRRGLADRLYVDFYTTGGLIRPRSATFAEPSDPEWVEGLRAANRSTRCRDEGWTIVGRDGPSLLVRKNGLLLRAHPRTVRTTPRGASILVPNENLRLSPGFYMAASEASLRPRAALFRIYWNLGADGARGLMRHGTLLLNRAGLPFRLKVRAHPAGFDRCDAAVLYAQRSDRAAVFAALDPLVAAVRPHLRPATPVFTKEIAPGVAVAEEPRSGESFGRSRCAILAEALIRSAGRSDEDRFRRVRATFARRGIPLERAFLDPGSRDVYPPLRAR